ncbi:hypothetical protein RISK_006341 [Rhodopirellula islandica]|uniref:Uncharacterized protein n=1 Tax=Rhodopirellula islandica TaxID=595434 RepID=A0A0J1B444_RHOIS|nr:hypothetical protein RISK_006341 [Rhodopirellula islandica]
MNGVLETVQWTVRSSFRRLQRLSLNDVDGIRISFQTSKLSGDSTCQILSKHVCSASHSLVFVWRSVSVVLPR